ncbi:MAG: hypothetical protein AB8I08_35850 [Sandaracinaceae bacterium]
MMQSQVASFAVGKGVLYTAMVGQITRTLAESSYEEFVSLALNRQRFSWIMDTTYMTGFDANAIQGGKRWFELVRSLDARLVVVSPAAAAKMAAATLSFSTGVPTQAFDQLDDAQKQLELTPSDIGTIERRLANLGVTKH